MILVEFCRQGNEAMELRFGGHFYLHLQPDMGLQCGTQGVFQIIIEYHGRVTCFVT